MSHIYLRQVRRRYADSPTPHPYATICAVYEREGRVGYYPVFLDLDRTRCLVIGGGTIAERKVEALLAAGGEVTLISPELTAALHALEAAGRLTVQKRPYQPGDLEAVALVIAATDDPTVQQQITADAKQANILCNIVDQPAVCSFIAPAVVQQGDLTIAVSTSGASPALAKKIRQDLAEQFGPEYALALRLLRRIRERLRHEQRSAPDRQRLLTGLAASALLDYLRDRQTDKLDALLRRTLGEAYTLERLAFSW